MAREGVDFEVGDEAGWSAEGAGDDGAWDTLGADGLGAEEGIDVEEYGDDDLVPMVGAAWTVAGFVGQTHTGEPWKSRPWSNLSVVGRVRLENVERDDGGHKQVAVQEDGGDDGDEGGDGGRSWGLVGEVVGMDVEDPYTVETVEEDHAEED